MNIKRYNEKNSRFLKGSRRVEPTISMQPRGSFRFNALAMKTIGAKVGDRVEFLYSESDDQWYITLAGDDGLQINNMTGGCGVFTSVILQQDVAKTIPDHDGGNVRIRICDTTEIIEGTPSFPLITR